MDGKLVNRHSLQFALEQAGFKASFATVYRDMTAINQKNTWVRDLAQSNYLAHQEQITNNLEWIETKAAQQYKETKSHLGLGIIHHQRTYEEMHIEIIQYG